MKTLSIDIETYSGTDLNKCGVYKYGDDRGLPCRKDRLHYHKVYQPICEKHCGLPELHTRAEGPEHRSKVREGEHQHDGCRW